MDETKRTITLTFDEAERIAWALERLSDHIMGTGSSPKEINESIDFNSRLIDKTLSPFRY